MTSQLATSAAAAVPVQPELILRSVADGVCTLTLNRPQQFNAINLAMLDALQAALDDVAVDSTIRVVVVAGTGRAFSPGHDLKEMLSHPSEAFVGGLFRRCCDLMLAMRALPQPVIAKVHGVATAAGCQLVAASDLAVAADDARFATSGINYGLFCATPAVPLSRNIAMKRAFEMLMTGEFIDAKTALAWGLINRAVPPARLDDEVNSLARSLMAKPRQVIAAGKRFFYTQLEQRIADAYRLAADHITQNMLADEGQEGARAFADKRAPRWAD